MFPCLKSNCDERYGWQATPAFDGRGVHDPEKGEMMRSLLPHVADLLVFGSSTPTTPRIKVDETRRRIKVSAQCKVQGDLQTDALLLYMISPERSLRLPNLIWETAAIAAKESGTGEFESPLLPEVPPDHGITFMVVVRERVERPPLRYWRSSSSLPQEHFPLSQHDGKMLSWRETPR